MTCRVSPMTSRLTRVCPTCGIAMHHTYDRDVGHFWDCPECFRTTWEGDPEWTDE